jgi:hypothetical protein
MCDLWKVGVLLLLVLGMLSPVVAAEPDLSVQSPAQGAVVEGADIKVMFTASSVSIVPSSVPVAEAGKHPEANKPHEGHIHMVLDLQPLVIWEKTEPYTFRNVPPGEHQLMVELVNNDHSSLTPPVVRQISFRSTLTVTQLPNTGDGLQHLIYPTLFVVAILLIVVGRSAIGRS